MSAPPPSAVNIRAATNKANSAFKALVNAMARPNGNAAPLLQPAVNAIRALKSLQQKAPNVAANVFGTNVPRPTPEAAGVNIFANLKVNPNQKNVLNAAAYVAAVTAGTKTAAQVAANRKIGKGLFGYKNKSVEAFWKKVDEGLPGANKTVTNFKSRIPRTANGAAFNITKYLNSKPNVNANRLIGRGGKLALRKYQNENLRKFWTNVNSELKKRGKPVPNVNEAQNGTNTKVRNALKWAKRLGSLGVYAALEKKYPYSTAPNRQTKVNVMANYLGANVNRPYQMASAWVQKSRGNRDASNAVKLAAFKAALAKNNKNALNVIRALRPLGESTDPTIIKNALLVGRRPEPETKAERLKAERKAYLNSNEARQLVKNIFIEFQAKTGTARLNNTETARRMVGIIPADQKALKNAILKFTPKGARVTALFGTQKENWTPNTFREYLAEKYPPAAEAPAAPEPRTAANNAINKLKNKKWFTNYTGTGATALRAAAYLRTNPTPQQFKNDMNTMATAGGNYDSVRNYIMRNNTTAPNTAARFTNNQVRANVIRRRAAYAKLKANESTAATALQAKILGAYTALGAKARGRPFTVENRKIIENLAKGALPANLPADVTLPTGLNLTNKNNKAAALSRLLPGLTITQAKYGNINKSLNIDPQVKELLRSYLNKYTEQVGVGWRGNRRVRAPAPLVIIPKNRAVKLYRQAANAGTQPPNSVTNLETRFPGDVYNWSQARSNILKNVALMKNEPAILTYLPSRT